jgi:hypothetical protein
VSYRSDEGGRTLTEQERVFLQAVLRMAHREAFLEQADVARVRSRCTCGCPTIDLEVPASFCVPGQFSHLLVDELARVEGRTVGVLVFQKAGRLTCLELYDLAGTHTPFDLPAPDDLFSWEDLSRRDAGQLS